jgi:hypothetical protein
LRIVSANSVASDPVSTVSPAIEESGVPTIFSCASRSWTSARPIKPIAMQAMPIATSTMLAR